MASSATPEATPRLSEEAIPTHRSSADSDSAEKVMEKNGPVVAHVGSRQPGPAAERAKSSSGILRRSPSPTRKTKTASPSKHDKGRSESVASQKGMPASKTSVQLRQRSPQGKRVGDRSSANGRNDTIDLTDPEKLLQQLANVDLTDEDTDVLLEEAYALNKKLRAELQRQEDAAKKSRNHRLPPLDRESQAKLQEKTRLYGAPPPAASRPLASRSKASQSAVPASHSQSSQGVMGVSFALLSCAFYWQICHSVTNLVG